MIETTFLFIAGLIGGILNAVAGGGSFITFPALLSVGISPIIANATNTFASCAGYISGTLAFKKELVQYQSELAKLIIISLLGGISGAWILLQIAENQFREAIPWLLLFATILFIFGTKINNQIRNRFAKHKHSQRIGIYLSLFILLAVCTYGGFFNAGLGVVILSYFAVMGYTDINAMNGLKLLISSIVSLIAVIIFIFDGLIAWQQGLMVLIGSIIGSYVASHWSRRVSKTKIRYFVILLSCVVTAYYFYKVYLI